MSSNGLLTSNDLYRTASIDSSYFIKKGEPIISSSPVQIVSGNGLNVLSLSESNTGVATISNQSTILLGSDSVSVPQVRILGLGGDGRVYDEIYNRPELAEVLQANNSVGSNQINMNTRKIINLGTPTLTTDATTKAYVDGLVSPPASFNNFFNYFDLGNQRAIQSVLPGDLGVLSLTAGVYQFSAFFKNLDPGVIYTELDVYFIPNGGGAELPFSRTRLSPPNVTNLLNMVSSPFVVPTTGNYNFIIAMDGTIVTNPSTPGLWTSDHFGYALTRF